ncbi:MAG: Ycf51 family protein [Cyanobacteria bacterium P01_E01_bin.34]
MSLEPSLFATAARYCLILAGVLGFMTIVLWVREIRWRFAFFGYTAFTLLLAAGLTALSLAPIVRTTIPGAVPFSTVFDDNSTKAAISVPTTITPEQLEPTLRQAAANLYSYGRYSPETRTLTIRARTIVHPEPGISLPIYVGQVQRSMELRDDPDMTIEIDSSAFSQLRKYSPASPSAVPEGGKTSA